MFSVMLNVWFFLFIFNRCVYLRFHRDVWGTAAPSVALLEEQGGEYSLKWVWECVTHPGEKSSSEFFPLWWKFKTIPTEHDKFNNHCAAFPIF